jgi:hypothetical protein
VLRAVRHQPWQMVACRGHGRDGGTSAAVRSVLLRVALCEALAELEAGRAA